VPVASPTSRSGAGWRPACGHGGWRSSPRRSFYTLASVGPPELTAKAAITGTGNVGTKLTCKAAFLAATSVSYTWLRDAKVIPGASTATYVPVAADAGHKATCQVTATNGMGSTGTSATITIHAPAYFKTGTTPIAHVGEHYSYTFTATGLR
jgi:hypothetical protein